MSPRRVLLAAALALSAGCTPDWDALDPAQAGAGGGGGGSGHPACTAASDCGAPGMCVAFACDRGACIEQDAPDGAPAGTDTAGDCRRTRCDGAGHAVVQPDPSDVADDGNPCTLDLCQGTVASHPPVAPGTECGNGRMCDGAGQCVECLMDADCGGSSACEARACVSGTCTDTTAPAGASCGGASLCDGSGACFACVPSSSKTFPSAGAPVPIPDGSAGGATSTISVAGMAGAIVDVDVAVTIPHALPGELTITLVSPLGTKIPLSRGNGGAHPDAFAGTLFDDDAPPPARRVTKATFVDGAPLALAIPERDLGLLNGEAPNGAWTLSVADGAADGVTGAIAGWSITIATQPESPALPDASPSWSGSILVPDGDPAGASASLDVAGIGGRIARVRVTVDLPHHDSGQLTATLVAPSGRSVLLVDGDGATVKNAFAGTTFDATAPLLVGCSGPGCVTYGAQPVPLAVPEGALSALVGDDPDGTWTLHVVDGVKPWPGQIVGFSLAIESTLCPP